MATTVHSTPVRHSPWVVQSHHHRDRPQRLHRGDQATAQAANGRGLLSPHPTEGIACLPADSVTIVTASTCPLGVSCSAWRFCNIIVCAVIHTNWSHCIICMCLVFWERKKLKDFRQNNRLYFWKDVQNCTSVCVSMLEASCLLHL